MKIEMTDDLIGEDGSLFAGQIIDTETDAEAVRFIQAGYAKALLEAPAEVVVSAPSQESIEAELTALGVNFISGADLGSLIALRDASKAIKPNKPAKALPAEPVTGE